MAFVDDIPETPPPDFVSDGCTGVVDIYKDCCYEHDWNYERLRRGDTRITRREADARFRRCIQRESVLGRCSPVSWVRWLGVRLFGRFTL